ncbi:hypothetical protein EON64_07145 [archaeon]|nr:MAG: hypothetical protein EON64_07145 [archaeon]
MEDWDEIVMLEQRVYDKACLEGQGKVEEDMEDVKHEGLAAGMIKGSAIGFELGFYNVVVQGIQDKIVNAQSRPRKLLSDLEQRLANFPRTNSPEFDFDKEMQSMRALYRGSGNRLGKFPPRIGVSEAGEEDTTSEVSW